MSVIIDIPSLKKPKRCIGCPLSYYVEEDYDHFEFYVCQVEDWKESCTKTPISLQDAKTKILDSCPIKDYPIKPIKEEDEFELIEEYYNE